MIDHLWHIVASNVAIAAVLAVAAWFVHRTGRRQQIAHLLWLLVLAKLVTPPIVSVPLWALVEPLAYAFDTTPASMPHMTPASEFGVRGIRETSNSRGNSEHDLASNIEAAKLYALVAWIVGSAAILTWSLVHLHRFNRLLRMNEAVAPLPVRQCVEEVARRLHLTTTPAVYVTTARISPMVWYRRGRITVMVPTRLVETMPLTELRCIIAHELAHIKRYDPLVRYLEALACLLFWWNPVAWWARRNLRLSEEVCCDALALKALAGAPRTYANALVAAAEFLAGPATRPPVHASSVDGGNTLERRLVMILSDNRLTASPRWMLRMVLGLFLVLPVGAATAHGEALDSSPDNTAVSLPRLGVWSASSITAKLTTGDIIVSNTSITFEDGTLISLTPAYPGSMYVFKIVPALDPAILKNNRLCSAPITYMTLLAYNDFAMALHMYDDENPPDKPTMSNVTDLARKGSCASHYYYASQ